MCLQRSLTWTLPSRLRSFLPQTQLLTVKSLSCFNWLRLSKPRTYSWVSAPLPRDRPQVSKNWARRKLSHSGKKIRLQCQHQPVDLIALAAPKAWMILLSFSTSNPLEATSIKLEQAAPKPLVRTSTKEQQSLIRMVRNKRHMEFWSTQMDSH